MAETAIDLETGETGAAEPAKRKRGRPRGSTNSGGSSSRKPKVETEIESRLERLLSRLAELREGRGDDELAAAIREDTPAIAGAVTAITRPFVPARRAILAALAVAEPLFAFGRIGRILAGRIADRRSERAQLEPEPEFAADGAGDPLDYAPDQTPQPVS